jgi:hypothetical protein
VTRTIVFVIVIGLMSVSSWLMTRRARRVLSRSLGREVRAGEESSLRAWMSVPDAALAAAPEELGGNPAEIVLETANSLDRRMPEPWRTDHLSIRDTPGQERSNSPVQDPGRRE